MNLIRKENREELHKYTSGIVNKRGTKMLSIFCMPDHTHLLVGIKPSTSISDLVRDIKAGSSSFINENNGFAVISIGRRASEHSHTPTVRLTASANIFRIRRLITERNHSKMNTSAF